MKQATWIVLRWKLIFIFLMSALVLIGFTMGWSSSFELRIFGLVFELSFTLYGVVAIYRTIWQIIRARSWLKDIRGTVRSRYVLALATYLKEEKYSSRLTQTWLRRANRIATKPSTTDEWLEKWEKLLAEVAANHLNGPDFSPEAIKAIHRRLVQIMVGNDPEPIGIVIPSYQTEVSTLRTLLQTLRDQYYPIKTVTVVLNDNDPAEAERIQQVIEEVTHEYSGNNTCDILFMMQPERGKRFAMAMGFTYLNGKLFPSATNPDGVPVPNLTTFSETHHKYVINIDSDTKGHTPFTVLNAWLVFNSAGKGRMPQRLGVLTGDVRVSNRDDNILSEMTAQRYWRAFFVERAAQRDQVTCGSGPFLAFDMLCLEEIFEDWFTQIFMLFRTTFGDDRNATTNAAKRGWKSVFGPDSPVYTDCPTEWGKFKKQQTRWARSFHRENYILSWFMHKLGFYIQFDVVYQQMFVFVLFYILMHLTGRAVMLAFTQGIEVGLWSLVPYLFTILLYNELTFGLYGALCNKDVRYFLSPIYILYHFTTLLWLKFWAMFSINETKWGTKGEEYKADFDQPITD